MAPGKRQREMVKLITKLIAGLVTDNVKEDNMGPVYCFLREGQNLFQKQRLIEREYIACLCSDIRKITQVTMGSTCEIKGGVRMVSVRICQ